MHSLPQKNHQLALPAPSHPTKSHKRSRIDRAIEKEISQKTFILSTVILLLGGLLFLAGFYYVLNKDFRQNFIEEYLPVTNKPVTFNLELTNPEDEFLSYEDSVVVSGKTAPKAAVIVSNLNLEGEEQNKGVEANFQGSFSEVVPLVEGVNIIEVTAFDNEGSTEVESRTIYYSKEKLQ